MISLDNIVYILNQEADSIRRDIARGGLTEQARRHLERQVRLLEQAAGSLRAYIRERERPLVPVYDVARGEDGDDPKPPKAPTRDPSPEPAPTTSAPAGAWV